MKCKRCEREIEDDSNFCRYCGAGQKMDIKFNDEFYDTPQQREFLELFRFEMPIDKKLSNQYRRPIPDMDEFAKIFYSLYGEHCGYTDEPTLKGQVRHIYGRYAAQWLDDQIPNIVLRPWSEEDLKRQMIKDMVYNLLHEDE